jgi:hypothetical protein
VGETRENTSGGEASGISGWLLVLCVLLVAWEPLNLAYTASRLVGRLLVHDALVGVVLAVRLGVAALGIAAGLALWRLQSSGITLAKTFLLLSTAVTIAILGLIPFPSSRPPGTTGPLVAFVLIHNGAWLVYLSRSARVRRTFRQGPETGN